MSGGDTAKYVCPACDGELTTRNRSPDAWLFCEKNGGVALRDAALRKKLGDEVADRLWERLTISEERGSRRCPQCSENMRVVALGDESEQVELDACLACRIVWFDPVELARVERVTDRADEDTVLLYVTWLHAWL